MNVFLNFIFIVFKGLAVPLVFKKVLDLTCFLRNKISFLQIQNSVTTT